MYLRDLIRFLTLGVLALGPARGALAQAPTIGTELPQAYRAMPGSNASMLGPTPGSGGGPAASQAVGGGPILGGRPGTATPRVPTSISSPGPAGNAMAPNATPAIPAIAPLTEVPLYGTLDLPDGADEGPADGLTFDQALEILLRDNLDLRARQLEIPSAKADWLTASLRNNPIFYADSQLIPYGSYSTRRPGGPTQYDVNVSQPVDYSFKRLARMAVASSTVKTVELQYKDAVRVQVANLSVAYVAVISARETLRYAETGLRGLDRVLAATRRLQKESDRTTADVALLEAQRAAASVGVKAAREELRKAKLALGGYLNLPPGRAQGIEIRASLKVAEPPLPPVEDLVGLALSCRPDVMAYRVGLDVAKGSLKAQYANRYADAYVLYQPYTFQNLSYLPNTHGATSWALGVTIPLPVFNRNQGNIERAKINIEQSRLQLANVERMAVEQVYDAEREYATTREALDDFERGVIPPIRRAVAETERLVVEGEKAEITVYLDVQRRFNDIIRQYRDAAVRHRRSMFGLNAAVGSRLLP